MKTQSQSLTRLFYKLHLHLKVNCAAISQNNGICKGWLTQNMKLQTLVLFLNTISSFIKNTLVTLFIHITLNPTRLPKPSPTFPLFHMGSSDVAIPTTKQFGEGKVLIFCSAADLIWLT